MKAHNSVDADTGLTHRVVGTAANVADVTQVDQMLHGEKSHIYGDAGYTGVEKRVEHKGREMIWSISARPGSRRKHGERSISGCALRKIEYAKSQTRAQGRGLIVEMVDIPGVSVRCFFAHLTPDIL